MNTISLLDHASRTPARPDDELREPMGLPDTERCRDCGGPVLRTDTPGLCWACMPCTPRVAA